MAAAHRQVTVLAGGVAGVVEDVAFPAARVMATLADTLVVIYRFFLYMAVRAGDVGYLVVKAGDTPHRGGVAGGAVNTFIVLYW